MCYDFLERARSRVCIEIYSNPSEFQSFAAEFGPNLNVFTGKKTKMLKIHVRFFKIQIGFHETDVLSKSEPITPSELREKFEKLKSVFFWPKKKNTFSEEHDIAL